MTHAYFCPDQDFVDAMKAAAQRGVDVRLLLPLKSNHIVADWISRGYFSQLLDAGVRIFRFRDAMVHAKTSTIDSTWSTIGTANVDRLSLQGNYEINVEVIDPAFAATHGGDLRRRRDELPRAHRERVGGPRPAPQVHRDDPGAAAPAALSPSLRKVDLGGHPVAPAPGRQPHPPARSRPAHRTAAAARPSDRALAHARLPTSPPDAAPTTTTRSGRSARRSPGRATRRARAAARRRCRCGRPRRAARTSPAPWSSASSNRTTRGAAPIVRSSARTVPSAATRLAVAGADGSSPPAVAGAASVSSSMPSPLRIHWLTSTLPSARTSLSTSMPRGRQGCRAPPAASYAAAGERAVAVVRAAGTARSPRTPAAAPRRRRRPGPPRSIRRRRTASVAGATRRLELGIGLELVERPRVGGLRLSTSRVGIRRGGLPRRSGGARSGRRGGRPGGSGRELGFTVGSCVRVTGRDRRHDGEVLVAAAVAAVRRGAGDQRQPARPAHRVDVGGLAQPGPRDQPAGPDREGLLQAAATAPAPAALADGRAARRRPRAPGRPRRRGPRSGWIRTGRPAGHRSPPAGLGDVVGHVEHAAGPRARRPDRHPGAARQPHAHRSLGLRWPGPPGRTRRRATGSPRRGAGRGSPDRACRSPRRAGARPQREDHGPGGHQAPRPRPRLSAPNGDRCRRTSPAEPVPISRSVRGLSSVAIGSWWVITFIEPFVGVPTA